MEKNLMIVPVSERSFNRALNDHIYAFPKSYHRATDKKYIALYRTRPIKAITHYVKIKNTRIGSIKEFNIKDRLIMFSHNFQEEIVIFELESLIELTKPIQFRRIGVQSCKYSSISKLLNSNYTDEL
jgi:hypothetical protein